MDGPGSEDEQVYRWRLEQLRRAGYDAEDANLLAADFDVDLHRAVDLLRSGCDPTVALEILT